jgi:hypothetical protein
MVDWKGSLKVDGAICWRMRSSRFSKLGIERTLKL